MKRYLRYFAGMLFAAALFPGGSLSAAEPPQTINWDVFSRNLVNALRSDNAGLQQSGMQFVIRYGERLKVKAALFDVVRIFRYHKERNVRLLALTAITKMNSNWAMYLLKRSIPFEKDPLIQRQLTAAVAIHQAAQTAGAPPGISPLELAGF